MSGRLRGARVVLWVGFLFQWSPFLLWMLYGTFYCGRRLIRSWTFQKCRAEPRSRTGLKVGFFLGLSFGSPPEPLASSPVQSNCTNLGSTSTHREFLSSSRIFSQSTVFIICSRPAVTFSARCVFLESAYPGIHAQAPCYEQGWVRPRVSLRKWAGRRSPVLTLLVFYI